MKIPKITSQRKTLGDSIYRHLRDEIISLRLQPGEMIFENEVATSFGVSRTPVREAFRLLLAEEFIEILPQRGVRIAYISKRKVEEAWFIRENFEVSVSKMIARNWDQNNEKCIKHRDEVLQCIDKQKNAASNQNNIEFFKLDEEYHKLILEQANNLTLNSFMKQVFGHVNRMRWLEFQETRETARVVREHEEIFNAICSGDEELTEILLVKHLRQSTDYSQKIMQKNPQFFRVD